MLRTSKRLWAAVIVVGLLSVTALVVQARSYYSLELACMIVSQRSEVPFTVIAGNWPEAAAVLTKVDRDGTQQVCVVIAEAYDKPAQGPFRR